MSPELAEVNTRTVSRSLVTRLTEPYTVSVLRLVTWSDTLGLMLTLDNSESDSSTGDVRETVSWPRRYKRRDLSKSAIFCLKLRNSPYFLIGQGSS